MANTPQMDLAAVHFTEADRIKPASTETALSGNTDADSAGKGFHGVTGELLSAVFSVDGRGQVTAERFDFKPFEFKTSIKRRLVDVAG